MKNQNTFSYLLEKSNFLENPILNSEEIILNISKIFKIDLLCQPRLNRILFDLFYVVLEQNLSYKETISFIDPSNSQERERIIPLIENDSIKKDWLIYNSLNYKDRALYIESSLNILNLLEN